MKAINKNLFREILRTKNRFLSILTICAIGVGFFSGVRATPNDMRVSADNYYDESRLFDLRVMSTFGLTDNDAAAIAEIDGVDGVYPSKFTDLAMYKDDNEYLTRVYSWNNNEVNIVNIVEGRAPEAENEIIVSYNELNAGIKIGEPVSFVDITKSDKYPIKYNEYTVVGLFESPMYISLTQRGSTSIGNGSLDSFAYISESNFVEDIYTEIYVKSDKMTEERSYSEKYERLRDEISEKLEELGKERSVIRYDEVLGEALKEIADGEKELEEAKAEGERELNNAKQELEDAAKQIADGEEELAAAKAEIDDGAIQLEEAAEELSASLKELENGEAELADAKRTLDESKAELDRAQAEIDENTKAVTAGFEQLEAGRRELTAASAQYDAGLAEYNAGVYQYEQAKKQLDDAEAEINKLAQIYGEDNEAVIKQRVEIEAARTELEKNKLVLDLTQQQLEEAKAKLDASAAEIDENERILNESKAQLETAQKQLDEGWAQYNDGYSQYIAGKEKLEKGRLEYNDGAALLSEKRSEYEKGVKEYEQAVKDIEEAKQKYSDGLIDYEEGKETFIRETADAEKKIADAKEKISDAGNAEWYVFIRDDNIGYAEYESNSQRIGKIADIFPVFFLLVAALVCLTTMSRMVEEQRTQIGTLKALGYSNGVIMKHYMAYAISGAAVGSIIGAVIGMYVFPMVIIYAYSMMYHITDISYLILPQNIITSAGAMIAAIGLTVFFTCKKALDETPASLMRPKAPKSGKRVLIEKIGFIWNNMGFFGKVTGRNLFRYKRRMFMTIIGIAGCTALSLTGFGLKNSITDIVNLQYNNIYNYTGYIAVDDEITSAKLQNVYDELLDYNPDTIYTRVLLKQYTVEGVDSRVQCYITGVEDAGIFEQMIDFHERVSGEEIHLSDGAVITEKAAKLLGINKGDTAVIQNSDGTEKTVKIAGITEHYTGHFIYMTEQLYEQVFGASPQYNMVYFKNGIPVDDKAEQDAFSEKMLAADGVLSVLLKIGASDAFSEMVKIMDLVIIVLIISAGALAFVVLYNLTNVNITERIREIATLKVLGFYDREVSSYVFRENVILSLIGAAVGLGLGYMLCQFVVVTAEIDEVMFGRSVHAISYLWAFLITIAFSLIVNFIMTSVLKKISMVESLKSVE